jgi:hypothetical protein
VQQLAGATVSEKGRALKEGESAPASRATVRGVLLRAHLPGDHCWACQVATSAKAAPDGMGKALSHRPSRWDGSEEVRVADADRVGECSPTGGIHGRIAGAPAQREGRAG